MCELHEVKGCAVCSGLVTYEAPEPSEGKLPVRPQDGAGIVTGPKRPAFVHPEPPKREFPQWQPTTVHPRWIGKRAYAKATRPTTAKRLQPSDSLAYRAKALGVEL